MTPRRKPWQPSSMKSTAGCPTGGVIRSTKPPLNGQFGQSYKSTAPKRHKLSVVEFIESWIQQGLLHEDEYTDPIYRRPQTGLFIRKLPTEEANAT